MRRKSARLAWACGVVFLLLIPLGCASPVQNRRVGIITLNSPEGSTESTDLVQRGLTQLYAELGISAERIEARPGKLVDDLSRMESEGRDLVVLQGRGKVSIPPGDNNYFQDVPLISVGLNLQDVKNQRLAREGLTQIRYKVEEGAYRAGVLAGKMTVERTHPALNPVNVVGYLGCAEDPEEMAYRVGFDRGVHAVNPACVISGKIVGKMGDTAQAQAFLGELLKAKADVIFCTPGAWSQPVIKAAGSNSFLVITCEGQDFKENPAGILSKIVIRDDIGIFMGVSRYFWGDLPSGLVQWGIGEGVVEHVINSKMDIYLLDGVRQALLQPVPPNILQ